MRSKKERIIQKIKAYNKIVNASIPVLEELQKQENLVKEIERKVYENYSLLTGEHIHCCAYELISKDKRWLSSQCKKECKKITEQSGKSFSNKYDYCDICPKMTYIKFDNDFNVMFALRNFEKGD